MYWRFIRLIIFCVLLLAPPEELLLGEEAGYCDHGEGVDEAAYDAPEW